MSKSYAGYDADETAYSAVDDLTGDTLLEQTENNYDAQSGVELVTQYARKHTGSGTGALNTSNARRTYAAMWYDGAGRQTDLGNYGTNGGSTLSRPSTPPSSSSSVLVTQTSYDAAGQVSETIDPNSKKTTREFDDMGRVTKTIQNDVASPSGSDDDVTVEMAYNSDGLLTTLTAKNTTTGDQVTDYVYGTVQGTGAGESGVARADLLRAVIYPDSDDTTDPGNGNDGNYDRVEYCYNAQGEVVELKDQNETVHAYTLDHLGRLTRDAATLDQGSAIDDTVLRIDRSYNLRGLLEHVTSTNSAGTTTLNDVRREYNDLDMLYKEFQEHEGAKDGSTLYVEYDYDDTASGGVLTKGLRPESVRYPNDSWEATGRVVYTKYGTTSGTNDLVNRVEEIWDSAANKAIEYSYLGQSSIVIEELSDVSSQLDYYTSGTYGGFDRFSRVVEHDWSVGDDFSYGYDLASNRTYREHVGASSKDEYYTYDDVRRLKNFDRGNLNVGETAISGTPVREEDFTLDPTGNWTDYLQKTSGSTDLNQDRTQNKVNETTNITETTGTVWITPAHDAAGNMTTVPKPSSLANGYTCTYDAWNRLVEVKDSGTVVGKYEYDGLNRRIKKHRDSQSPASPNGVDKYEHYFYNTRWQLLETRESSVENTGPESLQPKYQYVYSLRYIDAVAVRHKNTDTDWSCDDESLYYIADANFVVLSEMFAA